MDGTKKSKKILILPGDGIGTEVMGEVKKIIHWLGANRDLHFDVTEDKVGGAAYDTYGTPLADETLAKAQAVDAVLLGAVGGPQYDDLPFAQKPERGLLRLRKDMDLFANLRPAQCFDALADFSSLKKTHRRGAGYFNRARADLGQLFWRTAGDFHRKWRAGRN